MINPLEGPPVRTPFRGATDSGISWPWIKWFQGITDKTSFVTPPTTAVANGVAGQMAFDANYLYICVAKNTWRRVLITAW